jgi:hypothetical protein
MTCAVLAALSAGDWLKEPSPSPAHGYVRSAAALRFIWACVHMSCSPSCALDATQLLC